MVSSGQDKEVRIEVGIEVVNRSREEESPKNRREERGARTMPSSGSRLCFFAAPRLLSFDCLVRHMPHLESTARSARRLSPLRPLKATTLGRLRKSPSSSKPAAKNLTSLEKSSADSNSAATESRFARKHMLATHRSLSTHLFPTAHRQPLPPKQQRHLPPSSSSTTSIHRGLPPQVVRQ